MNRSLDEKHSSPLASIPKKPSPNVLENQPEGSEDIPMLAIRKDTAKKKKLKKIAKKRQQNEQSASLGNHSNSMASIGKTQKICDIKENGSFAIQVAKPDENPKQHSKTNKRTRADSSGDSSREASSSETECSASKSSGQKHQVALAPSIMLQARLQAMVEHFDEKEMADFAWKIHVFHKKKHQTEYWYDFRPPEKYCSSNAFVPLQYNSLIPSDTKKNQIKKKTTSTVLKHGVQGIHFAIGWQELFGMILEYGIFANDPFFESEPRLDPCRDRLPDLIGFRATPLDLLDTTLQSPTMGSVLVLNETKQSRKVTQGVKYTTTPSPEETVLLGGTKRKAGSGPDGESIPIRRLQQSKKRSASSSKKIRSDSSKAVETQASLDPSLEEQKKIITKASKSKPAPIGKLDEAAHVNKHRQQVRRSSIKLMVEEEEGTVKATKSKIPAQNEEEPDKWANWRPSRPPTPPVAYWLEKYGAHYV